MCNRQVRDNKYKECFSTTRRSFITRSAFIMNLFNKTSNDSVNIITNRILNFNNYNKPMKQQKDT